VRREAARLSLTERLIDPLSPEKRPRRAAYALPTLFTAGNVFLGFVSILQSFQGAMQAMAGALGSNSQFEAAAKMIGIAVFLDGLDGRIARLTNTESAFGREMDSLADVITFGLAPAVLAFAWGMQFIDGGVTGLMREHFFRAGYFVCFLYLLCGAARLARFNVQTNPVPKNPGRPDRKYFVGLPIPAAAALVAAVVYAADSAPLVWWPFAAAWLTLLALLSFLMVSTWRYRSFKDMSLLRPRSPLTVILLGALIYLIWNYSRAALLGMAVAYVGSGIFIRLGGIARRRFRPGPHPAQPEHQTS
jgi:CDP-diacylglycerol--serine O-phosphatidyltransferase